MIHGENELEGPRERGATRYGLRGHNIVRKVACLRAADAQGNVFALAEASVYEGKAAHEPAAG